MEDDPSLAEASNTDRDNTVDTHICYFPKHFTIVSRTGLQNIFHELNEMIQLFKRKNYNRSLTALKFSELLIKSSREHFWAELQTSGRENSKSIVKIHELLSYIHQNYPQKISSETIESALEINFDYLNRTFSKLTGHTIIRYLNMVRINNAKELIAATNMKMSEIGYLVGLDDPFYFSKVFKKYTSFSPQQYYLKIREPEASH
ncbi:helix-turn-helix transcriptional regulator [Paenibacillus sp. TAF58]